MKPKKTKKTRVDVAGYGRVLRNRRPKTKEHLRDYIHFFMGVDLPDYVLTEGHSSAMDYLWFAFNADFETKRRANNDCVVWANREGGKTQCAAICTLLDCLFKPNVKVRILSGSGYQAGRMYEYFEHFLAMGFEQEVLDRRKYPVRTTWFKNGAEVEVLVQSEVSVRGQHVNKLRCDEGELFKPPVYEAAQYTTMSDEAAVGSLEVISTMHRPHGLMKRIIKDAEGRGVPIFKWNMWDVFEKCEKVCKGCVFEDACGGKAKEGRGFLNYNDAVTKLERTNRSSFNYEMLCGEGSKKNGFSGKFGWRLY